LRQLALEGGAPGVGVDARAVALVAHVGELLAQRRHQWGPGERRRGMIEK
jgi:hypothetical protein